jgi:magnesium transporter
MQFEASREYLDSLKTALEVNDDLSVNELLKDLHPADIAGVLDLLGIKYSKNLFSYLDEETSADVIVELEDDTRAEILKDFDADYIVTKFIKLIDSDDAADIINELPEEKNEEIVNLLNKSKEKDDQEIVKLLEYDEDTAGGLMAQEMIKVNINDTVSECIDEIRNQAEDVEKVYSVYVVDNDEHLLGIIPLKKLVLSPPGTMIKNLYGEEVHKVNVNTSGEEVSEIMRKYDLVAIPVVDENNKLIGRITIDDVVDFMKEEAEEDYQLISGISEDVKTSDKVWVLTRARLPWLLLGLLGGVTASMVIGVHEASIQIYPEMAFFIPLITAMAGNAGVQSSSLVVQALAGNTLKEGTMVSRIAKEFSVSFLNGIICAAILLSYGLFFNDSLATTLTISISLLSVIIIASLLGLIIPLFLDKFKIDPALATGPFITTSNDLIGLAVYFYIGHVLYSVNWI